MINPLTSNACCSKKTNMRFKLKIITCFLVCFALGIFSGCKSLLPRVQILRKVEIGILMPKEELDVNKKSPETLSMQDARELKVFFKNRNLSSEILLFQNVVENPEILSSYKTILVIKQDLWTKSFWKAIDAYIKHGGNVFWQGLKTVEMMPSEYEQKYFDKLCGLKYGDYKYDKILRGKTKKGQSYLEEYIWIKPNQTTDIFSSNARDYYSISAGVKLDIIPTDGIVAASWRSKNKEQEQGAALIVKKYFRGRTAFSSAATLSIASTESPIEKKHARELVMLILNWMEHDINITKTFKVSYKDLFPERSYNSRSLPYTPSYSEKALILQKLSECITPKKQQKLLEFCGLRKINSLYLFIGSPKILQYQKSA
ncbi:MAG: hypothetical protein U9O87_11185, partial [Verrucomicrobiota bacterium]|nr:hypothetical protein [Verrucomicrobiota bacterium]